MQLLPGSLVEYTQWSGIGLLICTLLLLPAFLLKWGVRFRLVGATGLMGVLTAGLFVLSLIPFTQTVIPGAIPYSLVYDNAGTRAVIVVPTDVTQPQLEATLEQAASNLYAMGRIGVGDQKLTIRARALLHPRSGTSELVFLGQIQRSLSLRDDPNMTVTIFEDQLTRLASDPSTKSPSSKG